MPPLKSALPSLHVSPFLLDLNAPYGVCRPCALIAILHAQVQRNLISGLIPHVEARQILSLNSSHFAGNTLY